MSDFLRTVAKYSEAQPRWPEGTPIDHATGAGGGRWRSGDAPSLGAENVLEGYSEHAQINDKGWIVTSNVDDAVRALNEGRHVELMQVREVATLLDRLAAIALAAEELGEKAPVYDLCKVSVRGTNLFCADAFDIAREKMPQFLAFPKPGSEADKLPRRPRGTVDAAPAFLEHLKRKGYTAIETTESAAYLRASQRQLNGAKVGLAIRRMRDPTNPLNDAPPLIVSEDNYIIDGHHRWAAHVGIDSEDNNLGDVRMPIIRVNIRVLSLLEEANKFTEAFGMTRSTLHKSWLTVVKEAVWREELHPRHPAGAPDSQGGEFAPSVQGPARLTISTWEYRRPGVRSKTQLHVLYNPSREELLRWAGRDMQSLRYLRWGSNTVWWDAYEALHEQVKEALLDARIAHSHKDFIIHDNESAAWGIYGAGEVALGLLTAKGNQVYDRLFRPVKKSWLSSVVQFFKEAAEWAEAEHPRGKTTPESNSGSFRPKNSAQGELFNVGEGVQQVIAENKAVLRNRLRNGAPIHQVIAAATDLARVKAWVVANDILSGEDVHTWITADMLQNEALAPMIEAYLITEQRDVAMRAESMAELSEIVRKDLAFGDDELKNANYEWATALDSYIGSGYNEINGYFRNDTNTEIDEDTDEFKDYVSQYMGEEENEVLASAQERYIADNLNDWVEEDPRWTELNDRLGKGEITQEQFEAELEDLRVSVNDEKSPEFYDSDYYTDAMSDLEERAKEFARAAVEDSFRERVALAEDHAREIKELIDHRPATPITLRLHRGVKTGNSINWGALKAGDEITFSGFTSASSKRDVAVGWGNKTIEFVVPAGSKDVLFTTNDGEGEVIFNHGVKGRVLHRGGATLVVYLDPAGDGEDPEEEEVGKADGSSYVMNFGRLHTEPVIVPALRVLKRDWREEDHPRGKTTPESTPGSFAPSAEMSVRVHAMTSAKLGQLTPKYSKPYTIKVLKNPTQQDLKRWAGRDIDAIRFMISEDGDVYVWNAEEAYHDQLQPALGSMNTEFISGGDSEDIVLEALHPLIQAADERLRDKKWKERGWKRPTKFLSQWLLTKAEWNEEDHPRGKTTPESNDGSFAPKGEKLVEGEERDRNFKEWFGRSVITNPDGTPKVMYHATRRAFSEFSQAFPIGYRWNINNSLGFWFSEEEKKAERYSYMGPTQWTSPEAHQAQYDSGLFTGANVIPVYLRMENPLIFSGEPFTEARYKQIDRTLRRKGFSALPSIEKYKERFGERIDPFHQLEYWWLTRGGAKIQEGDKIRMPTQSPMTIRRRLEDDGYDGIILRNTYGDSSLKDGGEDMHIVIRPEQIKSVFNRGTFSRNQRNISKEWEETEHPRGKTTPESNDGSFRPAGFNQMAEAVRGAVTSTLMRRLRESGGFTYQPFSLDAPTEGYALSIVRDKERVFRGGISEAEVEQYQRENERLLNENPHAHLGGWVDTETGNIYLDISIIEPNLDKAIALAREHGQEGIYDLGKGQTIIVKRPEERRKSEDGASGVPEGRDPGANRGASEQAAGKSWLQVVKEWREDEHPRGKTTPESNSGSFAPRDVPAEVAQVARDWTQNEAQWDWTAMQHAAQYVLSEEDPGKYVLYDYHGDDQELLRTARQVIDYINTAPEVERPLYRGLHGKYLPAHRPDKPAYTDDPVREFKVGDEFSESLSSWTEHQPLAQQFADDAYAGEGFRSPRKGVVLMLEGGRGLPVSEFADESRPVLRNAKEWLASGHYRVTAVEDQPDGTRLVRVRRLGNAVHAKLEKSWLQIVKEAVWREEEHPRGKTTAESNEGSFAPSQFKSLREFRSERNKRSSLGRIAADDWRDGQIIRIGPTAHGWVDVIKNPTHQEVQRFADRGMRLRYSIDFDSGNYAVWSAHASTHWEMERALGFAGYGGGLSANNEDLIPAGAVIEHIRHKVQYALKTKLIDDDQYDTLMEKLARVSKSSWLDTLLKYVPWQARWPEGTPVDPETGAGGGRWAPSTEHAGYNFPKDENGRPIKGEQWRDRKGNPVSPEIAARLKGIPPGYTDIVLNADPTAPCIAIGKDSKGREKRMFSKDWHGGQAQKKWEEIRRFNQALPEIRRKIEHAIDTERGKNLIAAQVLYVLDVTGYRIGGGEDDLADKDAFGITTITSSHVKVSGDKVSFNFPGKKGMQLTKTIDDARLATIIRNAKADASRNQPIFDVSASKVNAYLKELTGTAFSAKDFRTWNGTAMAIIEMGKWKTKPRTEKEMLKRQRVVLDKVANWLGNTRAVAKSSYVDPAVWEWWA